MKSRIALLVPASILVFAAAASAQLRTGTVELNPFGGWLFGGEIAHVNDFHDDFDRHTHVDVSDDAAYGGRIGYNFTSMFQLEAEYSHTDTNFVLRLDNAADQTLGDLKVDYFMSYATFNFGHRRVVPFFTIGAGAANLIPNVAGTLSTSEVRFTTAAGGGVKVFLCPWFAFRFDGKLYETYLGDHSHVLCDDTGFCNTRTWLPNVTTTGGFLFAF